MHKVASSVTVGSIGDLGRIARALADRGINIDAVGGGEGFARGGEVGVISMLLSPDDDPAGIIGILEGLDLGNGRTLQGVRMLPAFDLELEDTPGRLADAASVIGDAEVNIAGIVSVDVHRGWGIVSLAFEDTGARATARNALRRNRFTVMSSHGGRGRRHRVDDLIGDQVPFGEPVDGDGHDDDD